MSDIESNQPGDKHSAKDKNHPAKDKNHPAGDKNHPAKDKNNSAGDKNNPAEDKNNPLKTSGVASPLPPPLRVTLESLDDSRARCRDDNGTPVTFRHGVAGVNAEFNDTVAALWPGCRLHLLEIETEKEGELLPGLIVLEPDYLLDISSLAECRKEYGTSHLHYFQGRVRARESTAPLLMGHVANLFFDAIINETRGEPARYDALIREAFRSMPFDFSTCEQIDAAFFREARQQFDNLRRVVGEEFPARGIHRSGGLIEPSFVCSQLGVQGRLDFLQLGDRPVVVELKSGKAPFPEDDFTRIGLNHSAQAFIYQVIIRHVLGIEFDALTTYILYSKYARPGASLRAPRPSMAVIREMINARNLIVATERGVAVDGSGEAARALFADMTPEKMIAPGANNRFTDRYIVPHLEAFHHPFAAVEELDRDYFFAFYSFVAREHFLSRTADDRPTTADKRERGDLLAGLRLTLDCSSDDGEPRVHLSRPPVAAGNLPDFREGDLVMLYEKNADADSPANKQVFKGTIQYLSPAELIIRFRYARRNASVFSPASAYAVEHDLLPASFHAMYRGLYAFLQATSDRRDLLLCRRPARHDRSRRLSLPVDDEVIASAVLAAKQALDFSLLVGPPGTGKTSVALRAMVAEFLAGGSHVLLLSFTNRAVDEICDALDRLPGAPSYVRLGPALSCAAKHRGRLLDTLLEGCNNRAEVKEAITACRVFVATTTAMMGRVELFKLKRFHVAIIDEASQILEPHAIGILAARDAEGGNAIDKFVLIGDHKQLPAVVVQSPAESAVVSPALRAIGLLNRRDSLFERLYRSHRAEVVTLTRQGRMHPDISRFPAEVFYGNRLHPVPVPHQREGTLPGFRDHDPGRPLERLLAGHRVIFIPSRGEGGGFAKQHAGEARTVAALLEAYVSLCRKNALTIVPGEAADGELSIGVITPYRSQIALIRQEIALLGVPGLEAITVDTVERYQGSQRDVILYSCCVDDAGQLALLANHVDDDGALVDRKLNVAITRARKQLVITGNPEVLTSDPVYRRLIEFIRAGGGIVG
ncbi:MAG: AAA family ATPase [Odoribacteraceae bacterium]|jgi:hypothetical protein|nr:AAA family ATPase [Odoribacteraceae bacterium]